MGAIELRLFGIDEHIDRAVAAIEADARGSAELLEAAQEFQRASKKVIGILILDGSPDQATREAIIALEQAGDSAKAVVEADSQGSEEIRQAILAAHDEVYDLKQQLA